MKRSSFTEDQIIDISSGGNIMTEANTVPTKESAPERYLYHSFPRPTGDAVADQIETGLKVLSCMVKVGLLLTPEHFEFPGEFRSDGSRGAPIPVFQKRISFTEIQPSELAKHSESFGPFSLEFDITSARRLGAMPVMYVPGTAFNANDFSGIGLAIVARLAETVQVLETLCKFKDIAKITTDKNSQVRWQLDSGGAAIDTHITVETIQELVGILQHGREPLEMLRDMIHALSGYFYATENPRYTDLLGYYLQREWRIISRISHYATPLFDEPTNIEKNLIRDTKPAFFDKEIELRLKRKKRIDACYVIRAFRGEHILRHARRIIVPSSGVERACELVADLEIAERVIALDTIAARPETL